MLQIYYLIIVFSPVFFCTSFVFVFDVAWFFYENFLTISVNFIKVSQYQRFLSTNFLFIFVKSKTNLENLFFFQIYQINLHLTVFVLSLLQNCRKSLSSNFKFFNVISKTFKDVSISSLNLLISFGAFSFPKKSFMFFFKNIFYFLILLYVLTMFVWVSWTGNELTTLSMLLLCSLSFTD